MNRILDINGSINDEGDEVQTSIESTDATAGTAVEWNASGCSNASGLQVAPVSQTIATYFDSFAYAGLQYAPWELTRVKYHRLDKGALQYFYKQSNLWLRFIVEVVSETESRVHDFASGLTEREFTVADFAVQ